MLVLFLEIDAVMRSILLAYANVLSPMSKKVVKIPRDVFPRKSSVELWDSIWGQ